MGNNITLRKDPKVIQSNELLLSGGDLGLTHSTKRLLIRGEETRGLDSGGGGSDLEKRGSKAPAPW